jgi:hypothetical protein
MALSAAQQGLSSRKNAQWVSSLTRKSLNVEATAPRRASSPLRSSKAPTLNFSDHRATEQFAANTKRGVSRTAVKGNLELLRSVL